jgi:CDP-2,3-bis-(O-geranylgeranyl)-sn-glycerol synthase
MLDKLELLLLVICANGAPILLDDLLGRRWAWPLDGGRVLADGRRLLGRSATARGVAAAVVATAVLAWLLGQPAVVGAQVGLFAMLGDALSSFLKRRLGLEPGDKAPGLDQVPESLLPLLVVGERYGLRWWDIALLVVAFTLFSMAISRLLFRLKLRKRPH